MWPNYLLAYLHYISIFMVVAGVIVELLLVRRVVSAENLKRIVLADGLYGLFSILLVVTGLIRAFAYGKGSDYYFSNWIFNLKFSLFIIVGLLSIIPTITFLKLRKKYKDSEAVQIEIPKYRGIKIAMILEITLLLIIPLLAILMANGVGAS